VPWRGVGQAVASQGNCGGKAPIVPEVRAHSLARKPEPFHACGRVGFDAGPVGGAGGKTHGQADQPRGGRRIGERR
jgi:hypothetical protein